MTISEDYHQSQLLSHRVKTSTKVGLGLGALAVVGLIVFAAFGGPDPHAADIKAIAAKCGYSEKDIKWSSTSERHYTEGMFGSRDVVPDAEYYTVPAPDTGIATVIKQDSVNWKGEPVPNGSIMCDGNWNF